MEKLTNILRREKEATREVESTESLKRRQLGIIEEYARENNYWLEDFHLLGYYLAEGGENEVYAHDDPFVYKLNNFEFAGDDVLNFFHRIDIHNHLFPEIKYELVGFGNNSRNEVSAIIKQPYVVAEREAFPDEIMSYMCSCGFSVKDEDSFRNEEYLIFDAAPHNVLVGIDGRLYFIDTQIKRLTWQY